MVEKKKTSRYSPEFRERAVRLLDEHRSDYPSLSAACHVLPIAPSTFYQQAAIARSGHGQPACPER